MNGVAVNEADRRRRYTALGDGEGPGDGRHPFTPHGECSAVGRIVGRVNPTVHGVGPP